MTPRLAATAEPTRTAVAERIQEQGAAPGPPARGVADGPVEAIDSARIPVAPLVGLAVLTLVCLLLLWRIFAARSRR